MSMLGELSVLKFVPQTAKKGKEMTERKLALSGGYSKFLKNYCCCNVF